MANVRTRVASWYGALVIVVVGIDFHKAWANHDDRSRNDALADTADSATLHCLQPTNKIEPNQTRKHRNDSNESQKT